MAVWNGKNAGRNDNLLHEEKARACVVFSMKRLLTKVRYIMLENSSIMLLSVAQKNLVLCPKLCSKNIALCSPDFYCIQHVLITTV